MRFCRFFNCHKFRRYCTGTAQVRALNTVLRLNTLRSCFFVCTGWCSGVGEPQGHQWQGGGGLCHPVPVHQHRVRYGLQGGAHCHHQGSRLPHPGNHVTSGNHVTREPMYQYTNTVFAMDSKEVHTATIRVPVFLTLGTM
jgi:hypothetical protein